MEDSGSAADKAGAGKSSTSRCPRTPRPNPGTPGGLPAGERKPRRVRCKVCSTCKQLVAADTARLPCETWGAKGEIHFGRELRQVRRSPRKLQWSQTRSSAPEEAQGQKERQEGQKQRMAECSDRQSILDDDKRDGGDGHGGSVPLLAGLACQVLLWLVAAGTIGSKGALSL